MFGIWVNNSLTNPIYTVGCTINNGASQEWHPLQDFKSQFAAMAMVNYLNGGNAGINYAIGKEPA